ncbi:MAG: hypothetical protein AB7D51_12520 [Desulfovibrionaceae bacterium]
MKIAVELDFFGQKVTRLLDYPGTPAGHAEVIRWLMSNTDYKWADYEHAPEGERMLFSLGLTKP